MIFQLAFCLALGQIVEAKDKTKVTNEYSVLYGIVMLVGLYYYFSRNSRSEQNKQQTIKK
jgi:hypothetical protein